MYSARVKNNENSWAERKFKQSSDRLANTPRRTWDRTLAGRLSAWQGCCKKKNTTNWAAYTQLKIIFSVTEAQKYKTNTMADSEYRESQSFWLVVAPTLDIPWQQGKARFLGTFVKGIIPLCISFMAYGLLKGIVILISSLLDQDTYMWIWKDVSTRSELPLMNWYREVILSCLEPGN